MPAKTTFEPYDRAKYQGRTGTVLNVHSDKSALIKSLTVLPDDTSRSVGAETWPLEQCARLPRAGRRCPRCGDDHQVFYCPDGR